MLMREPKTSLPQSSVVKLAYTSTYPNNNEQQLLSA